MVLQVVLINVSVCLFVYVFQVVLNYVLSDYVLLQTILMFLSDSVVFQVVLNYVLSDHVVLQVVLMFLHV